MKKILNLLRWCVFLWKDQDYDSYFLLKIMQYKMKRLRFCILNGYHAHADKVAKNIRVCELLLQRLMEDNYTSKKYEELLQKYEISDFLSYLMGKEGRLTVEKKKAFNRESRALHKLHTTLQQQDLELFCKLFKKHVFTWWD